MKYIKYIIVLLFTFLAFQINCFASTKTFTRTEDDLFVPRDVKVNNDNIEDIMNTPSVISDEKIYDFADIFKDSEEEKLYESIKEFIKATKIDSIIVTTNDLNGFGIANYTYNFYDYNDFKNEGIILVIYIHPDTNKAEIFMGNSGNNNSKVFKVYNDTNIKGILKHIYEKYIRKDDYYGACSTYLLLVKGLYIKTFGNYVVDDKGNISLDIEWGYLITIALALTFIIVVLVYAKYTVKEKKRDNTIKNSVSIDTMCVKKEYDRPTKNNFGTE